MIDESGEEGRWKNGRSEGEGRIEVREVGVGYSYTKRPKTKRP
jgi:hypothetical protein